MDRRQALTKLAVGGFTIAGATAISSRVAFAGAPPSSLPDPTVLLLNNGGGSALGTNATNGRVEIRFGTGFTCGGSATRKDVRWDFELVPSGMTSPASTIAFGTDQLTTTGPPAASPTAVVNWLRPGGSVSSMQVTIRAEFTCVYPSGNQSVCRSYIYTFTSGSWTQAGPVYGSSCPVAP